MFENKMKELEKELSLKTASVSELRRRLKEMDEREERAGRRIRQLEEQVRVGNSRTVPPRLSRSSLVAHSEEEAIGAVGLSWCSLRTDC